MNDHMEERDLLIELAVQFPDDMWYLEDVANNRPIEEVRSVTAEAEAKIGAQK